MQSVVSGLVETRNGVACISRVSKDKGIDLTHNGIERRKGLFLKERNKGLRKSTRWNKGKRELLACEENQWEIYVIGENLILKDDNCKS